MPKLRCNVTYLRLHTQFKMIGAGIQNIIFDLGGVILDLDTSRTMTAFADLAGIAPGAITDSVAKAQFFKDYEQGLITDAEFRDHLRKLLGKEVTDEQIDFAWNNMLGPLPAERLAVLKKLLPDYRVFLLSNTNNIHLQAFNAIIQTAHGHENLDPYFTKAYYSHLLRMRKPDVAIFEHVLRENNLKADETLFLDDNADNLAGARKAGIHTMHITHPDQILSLVS